MGFQTHVFLHRGEGFFFQKTHTKKQFKVKTNGKSDRRFHQTSDIIKLNSGDKKKLLYERQTIVKYLGNVHSG